MKSSLLPHYTTHHILSHLGREVDKICFLTTCKHYYSFIHFINDHLKEDYYQQLGVAQLINYDNNNNSNNIKSNKPITHLELNTWSWFKPIPDGLIPLSVTYLDIQYKESFEPSIIPKSVSHLVLRMAMTSNGAAHQILQKEFIPSTVRYLTLSSFSQPLEEGLLPRYGDLIELVISSATPPYFTGCPILPNALPSSLKRLVLGYYNQELVEGILPSKLKSIEFDTLRKPVYFPNGLEKIVFNQNLTVPISKCHLPCTLTHLEIGGSLCPPIETDQLPTSLTHLTIKDMMSPTVLPPSLTHLSVDKRYLPKGVIIPSTVTVLKSDSDSILDLNPLGVTELYLPQSSITNISLLSQNLTKLFIESFDPSIGFLPNTITTLSICYHTIYYMIRKQRYIELIKKETPGVRTNVFPSSLIHLICTGLNDEEVVNYSSLPPHITKITFNSSHSKPPIIPSTITDIEYNDYLIQSSYIIPNILLTKSFTISQIGKPVIIIEMNLINQDTLLVYYKNINTSTTGITFHQYRYEYIKLQNIYLDSFKLSIIKGNHDTITCKSYIT